MRSRWKLVSTRANSILALPLLVLFLPGCGRSASPGITDSLNQGSTVPQSVKDIIHAIDAGDIPKLKSLLEGGAIPTPKGSPLSPLHAAATHLREGQLVCDSSALQLLLEHGADPNFVDQYSGFSALEDVLAMGDVECARLLKDADADVDQRGKSGQSILQFAVKGAIRTGNTSILKLVLSWGVDPNVLSGGRANTALHEAVWATPGQEVAPVVEELLRSGANPCIADSAGDTAFDLATYLKRSTAVKKLLAEAMRECPGK
jgi:ankyrin repeat protein